MAVRWRSAKRSVFMGDCVRWPPFVIQRPTSLSPSLPTISVRNTRKSVCALSGSFSQSRMKKEKIKEDPTSYNCSTKIIDCSNEESARNHIRSHHWRTLTIKPNITEHRWINFFTLSFLIYAIGHLLLSLLYIMLVCTLQKKEMANSIVVSQCRNSDGGVFKLNSDYNLETNKRTNATVLCVCVPAIASFSISTCRIALFESFCYSNCVVVVVSFFSFCFLNEIKRIFFRTEFLINICVHLCGWVFVLIEVCVCSIRFTHFDFFLC